MSISTKRGDGGETDLLYGRRVAKTDIRVEACGVTDELNAAIGLARVTAKGSETLALLPVIQDNLVALMGKLATLPEDCSRYVSDGYPHLTVEALDHLGEAVVRMEKDFELRFKGWAKPGEARNLASAHLDLARTACRRAERTLWKMEAATLPLPDYAAPYLNRLSDVLWLLGRYEDLEETG